MEEISGLKKDEATAKLEADAERITLRVYNGEKRALNIAKEEQMLKEKQQKYKERSMKVVINSGRVAKPVSIKSQVKKPKKPQEEPQYLKDYKLYMGEIANILLMDPNTLLALVEGK